jgi:competence protein ComEC
MKTLLAWLLRSKMLLIPLCLLAGIGWWQRPDGKLHIHLPVSKGDAALIITPKGRAILIDGGSDPTSLTSLLGQALPFWKRDLDAVILSSPRSAWQSAQVAAFERYQIKRALYPPISLRNPQLDEWAKLLQAHNTKLQVAQVGGGVEIDGVRIEVLELGDELTSGLSLLLSYRGVRMLFDGAAPEKSRDRLAQLKAPVHVMLYPWDHELPEALLERLQPEHLIFSDAQTAKHPARLSTHQRARFGSTVYHEKIHGAIEISSDGRTLTVKTAKTRP